jgi:hypothetical protein
MNPITDVDGGYCISCGRSLERQDASGQKYFYVIYSSNLGPYCCNECIPNNTSHPVPGLSDFTDAEIANEFHWRVMQKLGDQTVGVGIGPKE